MSTFDNILPAVEQVLASYKSIVEKVLADHGSSDENDVWLVINRDLSGRVRLIAPDAIRARVDVHESLEQLAAALSANLAPHAYPIGEMILYESGRDMACQGASTFPLEGYDKVWVADRLAAEGDWADIAEKSSGPTRVVFYSIKGGVGRSTAVAATAWWLAEVGKRVLVMDLDLASPGLSSSLLPDDRKPTYGITDWLVEDLVDNGQMLLGDMIATSDLSRDGQIYVVPAHGKDPGEYVSKLGRVGMPKVGADGTRERWSERLRRLLRELEARINPDVVLVDSRSGIDEMASACVTDLGATLVLLFAISGSQTWVGYNVLFEYWRRRGVVGKMRERLQLVGALLPELGQVEYMEDVRDHAYAVFASSVYDEVAPGELTDDVWHFESVDEGAPHYPWGIKWHRSFTGLASLRGRMAEIDEETVKGVFGPLVEGVTTVVNVESDNG